MSDTKQDAWGQLLASKPTLDEVKAYFKGKGGGPEGESHIIDANADKKKVSCGFIAQSPMQPKLSTVAVMLFLIIAFWMVKVSN